VNVGLELGGLLRSQNGNYKNGIGMKERKIRGISSNEFESFAPHFPADQHFKVVMKSPSDVTEIARQVAAIEDRDTTRLATLQPSLKLLVVS